MARKPKTMLEEVPETPLPPDYPVNPELTSEMMIDVTVNRKGEVWVFHNKPFPGVLEWVEYDVEDSRLTFITKGGKLNDFGIEIGPLMKKYLKRADQAQAYLVQEKKIHDFAQVPIVVRGTTH